MPLRKVSGDWIDVSTGACRAQIIGYPADENGIEKSTVVNIWLD
jgi:hypothetical protein